MSSLKVFVLGTILVLFILGLQTAEVHVDANLAKYTVIIGSILSVLGGLFLLFDH